VEGRWIQSEDEEPHFAEGAKDWRIDDWKTAIRENAITRARKRFTARPGCGIASWPR
jgi:hypothetical protein